MRGQRSIKEKAKEDVRCVPIDWGKKPLYHLEKNKIGLNY